MGTIYIIFNLFYSPQNLKGPKKLCFVFHCGKSLFRRQNN